MPKKVQVKDLFFNPFIPKEQITLQVKKIAMAINEDYQDKVPLFLGILNGAFIFAADLIREITIPCQISFVKLASYSGIRTTEKVKELIGINEDLTGRHIIIVEDIVDSGISMEMLLQVLSKYEPASVKIACFFFKPDAFVKQFSIDYLGMEIPNDFIVGYGLDYDGYGRNLPDIYKIVNDE